MYAINAANDFNNYLNDETWRKQNEMRILDVIDFCKGSKILFLFCLCFWLKCDFVIFSVSQAEMARIKNQLFSLLLNILEFFMNF